jgi:hypothetical protein
MHSSVYALLPGVIRGRQDGIPLSRLHLMFSHTSVVEVDRAIESLISDKLAIRKTDTCVRPSGGIGVRVVICPTG